TVMWKPSRSAPQAAKNSANEPADDHVAYFAADAAGDVLDGAKRRRPAPAVAVLDEARRARFAAASDDRRPLRRGVRRGGFIRRRAGGARGQKLVSRFTGERAGILAIERAGLDAPGALLRGNRAQTSAWRPDEGAFHHGRHALEIENGNQCLA